ncbi:uncharacterized protein LOC130549067 [Triplophysa rosa]|uniref:uncharacterized protein LOC130549067 n=1 Tax=Triplophysa rosa TaxID=992332 RepID=UPI002545E6C3|nr:uncharacterized protein LOC130549067 [Triplophysa rosa]
MLHTSLVLCLWTLIGVFGDEVKSVSVMEGHSVTLHTHLTHIQRYEVMEWRFGVDGPVIASIMRSVNNPTYDNNGETEIFRDRLKMNNQTGDLTITDVTSQHSGLYHLHTVTSQDMTKIFNLTVNIHTAVSESTQTSSSSSSSQSLSMSADLHTPSGETHLIIPLSCAVAAGSVMIVIALLIYFMCRKHRKTHEEDQPRDDDITYAETTFYRRNQQKQSVKEEEDVVYAHVNTRR